MNKITSTQNEYIKQLCRLKTASGRRDAHQFIAEGHKLCEEIIRSGWNIHQFLATESEAERAFLKDYTDKTTLISENVAKKLSSMDTPPGIFAIVEQAAVPNVDSPRFILALDHLSDPSNLGAILRSAEAFGADLIVLSEGSVDLYSPKVLRGAMGSLFRVPIIRCILSDFLEEYKRKGYKVFGAGLNRNYTLLSDASFKEPCVMIIGNEAGGISEEIMSLCDRGLFIPMLGQNESLNAAVAASILLWEQSKWK